MSGFFDRDIARDDPDLSAVLGREIARQGAEINLIASENFVSPAVMAAQGSVLTNKYAEGYPGRRYYGGCEMVDIAEQLAIERVCKLFGAGHANVQPHSGAQANQGVMLALLKPGDTVLGMSLAAGGHLTHGARPNLSGKWFNAVGYGVRRETGRLDYDEIERLARQHRPKLIIAGASAYSRTIDFARFRAIADECGAILHVDMAHFAGLTAGGVYPNPVPHAHVVTSTTHKTLRGPRGGFVLSNDEALARKLNSAVFPGLQGGPLMHIIAAKAVAFREALAADFAAYAASVLANARTLAAALVGRGYDVVSGGTDSHLFLVDLTRRGLTGDVAEAALARARITCNKNGVPFDTQPPRVTSGIRLGAAAVTTRGLGTAQFEIIGQAIADVLDGLAGQPDTGDPAGEAAAAERIGSLCDNYPIYRQ